MSLITAISVTGVSVGVTALIVVMSVMTGFDNALRATVIGNRSHLTIVNSSRHPMTNPEVVIKQIEALCPEIVASGPIIQIEALLTYEDNVAGALIVGVDPVREQAITELAENLTANSGRAFGRGSLPGEYEVVLGYRLANRIGAYLGIDIGAITDKSTAIPFIGPVRARPRLLRISGISQAKMSDFDTLYAYVDIPTALKLTDRNGVDGVHVKLSDPFLADVVKARIEAEFPYRGETWYESQEAFFGALKQEKLAMFIILVFIILVAAFNIASTLLMVVLEKRRDIGILRTLGASSVSILLLFVLEGLMIGLSGTALGVLFGILLAYNITPVADFIADLFNVPLFDSTIYYYDHIPSDVVPLDVMWITIAAIVLTFASTLYPAWSASRLNPVDALRYE